MTSTDILLKLSAHILILLDNPQKIIEAQKEEEKVMSVSYTHLTLPTSDLV